MSSDLDDDVARVAARRDYETRLHEPTVSPETRRGASASVRAANSDHDNDDDDDEAPTATYGRLKRRVRLSDSSDDDDVTSALGRAASERPANKKKKRAMPRFAGDGLSDDEQTGARNPFDDDNDLWGDLDAVPNGESGRTGDVRDVAGTQADLDAVDDVMGGTADGAVDAVAKKKRTRAKIDEERLQGHLGFPALVQMLHKFKPKGKGHEFEDLKRLMSIYQLWAHRMFPRTNLADTLKTVEKLCHKRTMASFLRVTREELKHGKRKEPDVIIEEVEKGEREEQSDHQPGNDSVSNENGTSALPKSTFVELDGDAMWDDEEAIMREIEQDRAAMATQEKEDAILRELEQEQLERELEAERAAEEKAEWDDLEALAGGPSAARARFLAATSTNAEKNLEMDTEALWEDDEEEDEAAWADRERLLNEMEARYAAHGQPKRHVASSMAKPSRLADDEDDLYAVDEEVLRELEAERNQAV